MNHIALTVSPRLDAIAASEVAPRITTAIQSNAANGRGIRLFTSVTIKNFSALSVSTVTFAAARRSALSELS
jgi:hypothetical protein